MTKTFDLTPNELAAALVIVRDCLDAMGGSRPADLENDELTWTSAKVLMNAGWSAAEANGTFGALMAKGMIDDMGVNVINGKMKQEWALSTAGWRHLDTVWNVADIETLRAGPTPAPPRPRPRSPPRPRPPASSTSAAAAAASSPSSAKATCSPVAVWFARTTAKPSAPRPNERRSNHPKAGAQRPQPTHPVQDFCFLFLRLAHSTLRAGWLARNCNGDCNMTLTTNTTQAEWAAHLTARYEDSLKFGGNQAIKRHLEEVIKMTPDQWPAHRDGLIESANSAAFKAAAASMAQDLMRRMSR